MTPVTVRSVASKPVTALVNTTENVCANRPTIGSACGSMLTTAGSVATGLHANETMPPPSAIDAPRVCVTPVALGVVYDEPPPPPALVPDPPPPPK